MLLQKMIIKNFKGISEKQEIDLSVTNKTKSTLENNLMFKNEGNSLIPLVFALMGKNASGKTSIIDALKFTIDFVFKTEKCFNGFYSNKIIHNPHYITTSSANRELNKWIDNFIKLSFENKIKVFSKEYNLFLEETFNNHSHDQKNPVEIELIFKKENDFYKIQLNLSKNKLIGLTYKNDKEIKPKIFPFINFLSLKFYDETFHNSIYHYRNYEINSMLKLQWDLIEIIGKKKYNLILKMLDNNIKEIDFTINNAKKIQFDKLHMMNGTIILFRFLSAGTIKILKFIATMITNLKSQKKETLTIFVADEINNFLHIKLVDFLIKLLSRHLFNNNKFLLNNSQLFLTTHSPSTIEFLNRHAVWLIQNEDCTKIRKLGSTLRESNSFYNKFISEEVSSHPSDTEMNEVLYELGKK